MVDECSNVRPQALALFEKKSRVFRVAARHDSRGSRRLIWASGEHYSLAASRGAGRYLLRRFAECRSTPLRISVNVVASISIAGP